MSIIRQGRCKSAWCGSARSLWIDTNTSPFAAGADSAVHAHWRVAHRRTARELLARRAEGKGTFFTSSLGICFFGGLSLTCICCLRVPFEVLVNVHALLVPQDLILHSSSDLLKSIGRALLAWALTWPLLAYAMFLGLAPAFQYLRRRSVER